MSDKIQKNLFYDFSAKDYQGNTVNMSDYKGKVVLVCNIASECGLADKNYKNMQELRKKFNDNQLAILLFPCNQFLSQEPNSYDVIKSKIDTYFTEYSLFEKIKVKGNEENEIFKFLKSKKGNFMHNVFMWNFTKFIVDKKGEVVERYYSSSTVGEDYIEKLVNQ